MVKNNGEVKNEDAFWATFTALLGENTKNDIIYFDEFYANDFCKVQESCGYSPKAAEVIKAVKDKGLRVALATNPVFPSAATEKRISWAGLTPDDFIFYTSYENSSYCKPNPKYYLEIIEKLGVLPEECLMVGNDTADDMVALDLGMKVFLLTDCLINKDGRDISVYPSGDFDALLSFVKAL
jgi:HAD superfamily hydrolase (TIGR01549 family)